MKPKTCQILSFLQNYSNSVIGSVLYASIGSSLAFCFVPKQTTYIFRLLKKPTIYYTLKFFPVTNNRCESGFH